MKHLDVYGVVGALFIIGILEWLSGVIRKNPRWTDEWLIDGISISQLAFIIKPAIVLIAKAVLSRVVPGLANRLTSMPMRWALPLVLIPDDFFHYWYHRLAHESPTLWKWHLTHHSSPTYQVSLALRENWLWFAFMPGFWWGAVMVYLGLGKAYVLSTAITGIHDVVIHNGFTWDRKLYRAPIIGRLIKILEKVIQSPSEHRAHHGLGENGAPMGNYAQLLFIWDILFGTAHFPEDRLPERYGILSTANERWFVQLWWPFVRANEAMSDD